MGFDSRTYRVMADAYDKKSDMLWIKGDEEGAMQAFDEAVRLRMLANEMEDEVSLRNQLKR